MNLCFEVSTVSKPVVQQNTLERMQSSKALVAL